MDSILSALKVLAKSLYFREERKIMQIIIGQYPSFLI